MGTSLAVCRPVSLCISLACCDLRCLFWPDWFANSRRFFCLEFGLVVCRWLCRTLDSGVCFCSVVLKEGAFRFFQARRRFGVKTVASPVSRANRYKRPVVLPISGGQFFLQAFRVGPGFCFPRGSQRAANTAAVLRTRPIRGKICVTVCSCCAAVRAAMASSTKICS